MSVNDSEQNHILDKIRKLQGSPEGRREARELCFSELSANPHYVSLKLALARLFYLDGYYEFSLDILLSLRRSVSSPLLDNLVTLLGGSTSSEEVVLARMDMSSAE